MIPRTDRILILTRDQYCCARCYRGRRDGVRLHVDHVLPRSRGGRDALENYRTLCDVCNIEKSNLFIPDYIRDHIVFIRPLYPVYAEELERDLVLFAEKGYDAFPTLKETESLWLFEEGDFKAEKLPTPEFCAKKREENLSWFRSFGASLIEESARIENENRARKAEAKRLRETRVDLSGLGQPAVSVSLFDRKKREAEEERLRQINQKQALEIYSKLKL